MKMVKKERLKKELGQNGKLSQYAGQLKDEVKKSDKEMDEAFDIFTEAFNKSRAKKAFGDNWQRRAEYAISVVSARAADEEATPTHDVQVYVLGKRSPQERESTRGEGTYLSANVGGLGGEVDSDEAKEITIIANGEGIAEKVHQIEYGKGYELNVRKRSQSGDKVTYNMLEKTEIKPIDFEPDNVEKMLSKFFKLVDIADVGDYLNVEDEMGNPMRVMIKANVQSMFDTDSDGMGPITIYNCHDTSMKPEQIEEDESLFGVIVPQSMGIFGRDSWMLFIGRVSKHEQYGLGMFGDYAHPIVPIERKEMSDTSEQTITADEVDELQNAEVEDVEVEDNEFDEFMT